ncbi:transcriptional regulator, TetR family [Gemella bergeri ATCC 700627]|uniref:Transcriptional regulator, TetR family n=2 Tax=Gemella bergeri TaxID=84136 RepID=U2S1I1_9BACL|nr:transcriptional regulator, TetR family [Gemella bergeri ATCC 700627]
MLLYNQFITEDNLGITKIYKWKNIMSAKRLKKEERKKFLQDIAKELFLKKGFKNTTMQDIVVASEMSIGGLYHHYKSTGEILYDIMMEGNIYRKNIMFEKINNNTVTNKLLAELIVDKMLADNEFTPLYAMFLQQLNEDESLKKLFEKLKKDSINSLKKLFEKINCICSLDEILEFITCIINTFALGCELIDIRKNFIKNRNQLEFMIESYLTKNIIIK